MGQSPSNGWWRIVINLNASKRWMNAIAFKNGMDVLLEACFKEIADLRQGPFAIREVPNRTPQRIEGSFDHERSAHPSSKTSFNAFLACGAIIEQWNQVWARLRSVVVPSPTILGA